MIAPQAAYRAMTSRDQRFDGLFFVGVTSTGIYCRPICPVRIPQLKNCRFFQTAEAAEKAAFRPCLRCRPELAPGHAPVDRAERITHLLVTRINEGLGENGFGLEEISRQFALSPRQLRRVVHQQLGVSPIELLQTRRLLLAKQLLTETALPVIEIAFASGFASLRRFNDSFRKQYRMPPTRLRKKAASHPPVASTSGAATLQLSYRAPYDWTRMLAFLDGRKLRDVEHISGGSYFRTVRLGRHSGWIKVHDAPEKRALVMEFSHALMPVLPALRGRLENLFDLAARPDVIARHLSHDRRLRAEVHLHPGLRVPGAFDGFEIMLRAILGQQITVKAATTISGRVAEAFGEKIATPFPELTRLTPLPEHVAAASVGAVARLGIVSARARTIISVAKAFAAGALKLEPGTDPLAVTEQLVRLPGIGPWTAQYIAMRALRWPDAFPKEDIAVRKNLGGVSPRMAEEISQDWKPWRSYAVMHIWNLDYSQKPETSPRRARDAKNFKPPAGRHRR